MINEILLGVAYNLLLGSPRIFVIILAALFSLAFTVALIKHRSFSQRESNNENIERILPIKAKFWLTYF